MYLLNLCSTDTSNSAYSKLSSLFSPCLVICALYIILKAEPWGEIIIDVPLFSKPYALPSTTISHLINPQFYFLTISLQLSFPPNDSLPQSHSIESIISLCHQYDFSKVEFFSFYVLKQILAVVSLLYSGKSHVQILSVQGLHGPTLLIFPESSFTSYSLLTLMSCQII